MSERTWRGRPVRLRLVEVRQAVWVDTVLAGYVSRKSRRGDGWQWVYAANTMRGYEATRAQAIDALLAYVETEIARWLVRPPM